MEKTDRKRKMTNLPSKGSSFWQWAFLSFVIAGLTGFTYRLGFIVALPTDWDLINIRHAHSHLMFFGWASFLPLYFIYTEIIYEQCSALSKRIIELSFWIIMSFGLLSFVTFFLWGYQPVLIGSARIPVSAILSGFVMIGWYVFMVGYLIHRAKAATDKRNIWYESALVMLFVSSLGAWSVGLSELLTFGNPLLLKALTHFFLSTYTEGWIVLILLGFIAKRLDVNSTDYLISPNILVALIAFGAPLTFPYGISASFINAQLLFAARLGGVMIGTSVLIFIYSSLKNDKLLKQFWAWPISFLAIKAVMQIIASISPPELWMSDMGIRILYLHVLLLGAFTTSMVLYICRDCAINKNYIYAVFGSICIVLMSLVLLTNFWPSTLKGYWIYPVLAICATLPILTMSLFWRRVRTIKNRTIYQP